MDTFRKESFLTLISLHRVRYQVMSANLLDFKAEGNKLAEMIKQYDMNA